MSVRIALVTTQAADLPTPDLDTDVLLDALRAQGADAVAAPWRDPSIAWEDFDLVVIRSPWDYPEHHEEFLAWLDSRDPRRVANSPAIIRWDFDKTYLLALAARGVPIVPTIVCPDLDAVRTAAVATGSEWIVIKPSISAASRDTHLLRPDDPNVLLFAQRILDEGKDVLVEPGLPEIAEGGENALFIVDGEYTHAANKGPLLAPGGGLIGGSYAEDMSAVEPTGAEIAVAHQAAAAIAEIVGEEPLYGRYDVVTTARGPLLIEAELFEPQYFFRLAPGAVEKVAAAIIRRAAQR